MLPPWTESIVTFEFPDTGWKFEFLVLSPLQIRMLYVQIFFLKFCVFNAVALCWNFAFVLLFLFLKFKKLWTILLPEFSVPIAALFFVGFGSWAALKPIVFQVVLWGLIAECVFETCSLVGLNCHEPYVLVIVKMLSYTLSVLLNFMKGRLR